MQKWPTLLNIDRASIMGKPAPALLFLRNHVVLVLDLFKLYVIFMHFIFAVACRGANTSEIVNENIIRIFNQAVSLAA